MELGITIPLQKHLMMKAPEYGEERELFYCWELHRIQLQGKSTLVAVNASNRFTVVLSGMKAKDWKVFSERFTEALKTALREESYSEMQIKKYFDMAGEVIITKTHGRRPVAGLNRADEYLWIIPVPIANEQLYQSIHTQEVNRELCRAAGFSSYGEPVEFWKEDMKRIGITA